nr:hypothetical protein CFP56_50373 [Quercus suber]
MFLYSTVVTVCLSRRLHDQWLSVMGRMVWACDLKTLGMAETPQRFRGTWRHLNLNRPISRAQKLHDLQPAVLTGTGISHDLEVFLFLQPTAFGPGVCPDMSTL